MVKRAAIFTTNFFGIHGIYPQMSALIPIDAAAAVTNRDKKTESSSQFT